MIAAAVLAAGASRRLGRPKALVVVGGQRLVDRALAAAAPADAIAVVVGDEPIPIEGAVVLRSATPQEGIASSIRAAVGWARGSRADALVLLLVDQPFVDAAHVRRLLAEHTTSATATGYDGIVGAPAVFGRTLFADLAALEGDRGAGAILRMKKDVTVVPCPAAATDIDTAEDLAAAEGRHARRPV